MVTLARRLGLEEDVARFTRSLEEKRGVIRKLEEQSTGHSLPPKEASVPEAAQDSVQTPS